MEKKLFLLLVCSLFGTIFRAQTFNPYQLIDGKMPIFDNLFFNLQSSPALDNVITESFYNQIFSQRGNNFYSPQYPAHPPYTNVSGSDILTGKQVTDYNHFKAAVNYMYTRGGIYSKIFNEGNAQDIKRELAAVAAHAWQETKGFSFNSEQGYHPLYDTYAYGGYHGRGPKQISYSYNYIAFNNFLFGSGNNVLINGGKYTYPVNNTQYDIGPGAIAVDGRLAWLSALWFYLTPQYPKPSMHDVIIAPNGTLIDGKPVGFGMTTLIINGGIECGKGYETQQSLNRVAYYNSFLSILGITDNRLKTCSNLNAFVSNTVSLNIQNDLQSKLNKPILYPNPTKGNLNLKYLPGQDQLVDIEVYSRSGDLILKKEISTLQEFYIKDLANGNYNLKIKQKKSGNVIFSTTFIKIN